MNTNSQVDLSTLADLSYLNPNQVVFYVFATRGACKPLGWSLSRDVARRNARRVIGIMRSGLASDYLPAKAPEGSNA